MGVVSDAAFSNGDVMREIKKLKGQMKQDAAARRMESSSFGAGGIRVHSGGEISVEGGGAILAKHPDGSTAILYGKLRDANGFDRGTGLLIQDVVAENNADIFRAKVTEVGGSVVWIGGAANVVAFDCAADTATFRGGDVFIQHTTTSTAANAVLDPVSNLVQRSTSSLRYKRDVEDLPLDTAAVLALRPRTWRDKAEVEKHPDVERWHVGFVAEEVARTMPEAVDVDADGQPDSVSLPAIVAGLAGLCQAQQQRIEALEAALGVEAPADEPAAPSESPWPRPALPLPNPETGAARRKG